MAVATDADAYAAPRVGQFFPGVTPDLDGQCVSLVKWFLQDMTAVPDPQAARGDARYVGQALVAQGQAVEVPYADRKRGDVVCMEYGTYGHIYVQLSGGQVFEENVNWPGVPSEVVDGATVYASRIGSDSEAWRHDMHVYRINTYNEGDPMASFEILQQMSQAVLGRTTPVDRAWYDASAEKNMTVEQVLEAWIPSEEAKNFRFKGWDYDKQVAALKACQSQSSATQLKPGLYKV